MSYSEAPQSSFSKRFMQRHYSYRDHERATTTSARVIYVLGTNARAVSNFNWPRAGDWTGALTCYAREVKILCTQDVYIRFVSLNPRYLELQNQGYTATQIAALNVTQYITEVEQHIPANDEITFYPTYAYSIEHRWVSVAGTLSIFTEGNVEGKE